MTKKEILNALYGLGEGIPLKNGNQLAHLQITQREGAGYRWTNCLAILNNKGQWMLSCHWRSNAYRKALKEAASFGWEINNG